MRALHVICIYLKLRLRVHLGTVRKQDIVVLLICLSPLRILRNYDLAVEIHLRHTACNALEKLP